MMENKCTFCPEPATTTCCGVPVCDDCKRVFFPTERGELTAAGALIVLVLAAAITIYLIVCLAASPVGIEIPARWWMIWMP